MVTPKKTSTLASKPTAPKKAPAAKVEEQVVAPKGSQILYTFRIDPDQVEKLKLVADKKGVTHAQIARDAVAKYLAAVK